MAFIIAILVTYSTGNRAIQVIGPPVPRPHHNSITLLYFNMPLPTNAQLGQNEGNIQLALQAIIQDATLSMQQAVKLYNISQTTLTNRRAGIAL